MRITRKDRTHNSKLSSTNHLSQLQTTPPSPRLTKTFFVAGTHGLRRRFHGSTCNWLQIPMGNHQCLYHQLLSPNRLQREFGRKHDRFPSHHAHNRIDNAVRTLVMRETAHCSCSVYERNTDGGIGVYKQLHANFWRYYYYYSGFISFFGILFGLVAGLTFMIPIVECNKYFHGKKMLFNGIILMGTGLGSVIFGLFSYNFLNPDKLRPNLGYYNGSP